MFPWQPGLPGLPLDTPPPSPWWGVALQLYSIFWVEFKLQLELRILFMLGGTSLAFRAWMQLQLLDAQRPAAAAAAASGGLPLGATHPTGCHRTVLTPAPVL